MHRRNIYCIAVIGFIICTGLSLMGKSRFGEDDIKRILYYPAGASRGMSEFLVLDNVQQSGSLNCRYLGTNRQVTVQPLQVRRMNFFEDSSSFMISQYALFNIALGRKNNLPLQLLRVVGDVNNRLQLLDITNDMCKALATEIVKIKNNPPEDETVQEAISDMLEKNSLDSTVKNATSNRDWLLAIILYEKLYHKVKQMLNKESIPEGDQIAANAFLPIQTAMLKDFSSQQSIENIRRKNFSQRYPRARGAWTNPLPANYKALKKLFSASMRSYVQLDKISRIFEPQDWCSVMLDVLLMVEGSPGAAELEKEFDNAMRQLAAGN